MPSEERGCYRRGQVSPGGAVLRGEVPHLGRCVLALRGSVMSFRAVCCPVCGRMKAFVLPRCSVGQYSDTSASAAQVRRCPAVAKTSARGVFLLSTLQVWCVYLSSCPA